MRFQEILEACWKGYRQAGMKDKGGRQVPNCVPVSEQEMEEDLKKWFKEKWVRFGPDGKIRGDCARGSEGEGKPKCLPQSKAQALGKKGRASAAAKKRREDPNPERRGPAKNVATKVKEQGVAEGLPQTLRKVIPGYARREIDKKMDAEKFGKTDVDRDANFQRYKKIQDKLKEQGVAEGINEGLLYSGDTWQDVLYRINVLNDIFGDQKDLVANFEPASQPEWGPFRDRILRSRTVLDTYAKVKQLANMNVPLTDAEVEMLDDVAWDGGGGPVEPAGHWEEGDYDWLEDLYAQQFAVVQHLLDQRAQGRGQNKTKSGQTVHEQGVAEADLDEACWKGYHKEGMKTMFGKRYPNCVKNKNESLEVYVDRGECPGCGGAMVAEDQIAEKQDACYHKVKSRYKVWPSAYASGALVQCRKKGAANWGNKKK
jgi:hypothetical protein